MTISHGVSVGEVPTSVRPPIEALAGLPVVFGASPVVIGDRTNVNKPVLCTSMADFATKMGAIGAADLDSYSLNRFAAVYFGLYGMGPMIAVNVLDPDDAGHVTAVPRAGLAWAAAEMTKTIAVHGIDHETLVLDDGVLPTEYDIDDDYTLAYDDDGYTVITRLAAGAMGSGALALAKITYSKLNPAGVDAADIVGSTTAGGVNKGTYCLEDVYPQCQYAPGIVCAPGYSQDALVMAALVARAASINDGAFRALAVVDLSPDDYEISDFSEAGTWKSANAYTSDELVCCWPMVTLAGQRYELSSHFVALANQVDAAAGGVPYISPSNQTLQIDGTCLDDDSEVFLTKAQANVLNGQGIVTALNWSGWRLWGNRTAGYPASSDAKDIFIPIRRMTLWLGNTLVLTFFSQVDAALNRRLIDSIVDSANIYLNGLKGQGAIIAGECVFAEADNPTTDLLNGQATFRIYWTPPPPAESIEFLIEYDATALASLFT